MYARQYGSKVVHHESGRDVSGNVVTVCGRLLTDAAPDVNTIPGGMRSCRACRKAELDQAVRELRDEVAEYDKTTEWWGEGEDKGGDWKLCEQYSESLEQHAHGLATAAAHLLEVMGG